jgi:hypothetical protein
MTRDEEQVAPGARCPQGCDGGTAGMARAPKIAPSSHGKYSRGALRKLSFRQRIDRPLPCEDSHRQRCSVQLRLPTFNESPRAPQVAVFCSTFLIITF